MNEIQTVSVPLLRFVYLFCVFVSSETTQKISKTDQDEPIVQGELSILALLN